MHLSSVDLPDPLWPIRPKVLPSGISRLTSLQRPELLEGGALAAQDRGLERLVAVVVDPERLGHAADRDRRFPSGRSAPACRRSIPVTVPPPLWPRTCGTPACRAPARCRPRQADHQPVLPARPHVVVEHRPERAGDPGRRVQVVEEEQRERLAEQRPAGLPHLLLHLQRSSSLGVDDRGRVEPQLDEDVHEVLGVAEIDHRDRQHQRDADAERRRSAAIISDQAGNEQQHLGAADDRHDDGQQAHLDGEGDRHRQDRRDRQDEPREVDLGQQARRCSRSSPSRS